MSVIYQYSFLGKALMTLPLFCCFVVCSQNRNFQKLTTKQGLSHSTVYDIAQDQKGFIWVATREGLNRYDSHDIKTYYQDSLYHSELGSNQINALVTSKTSLYVGTDLGVCKYLPEVDSFKKITGPDFANQNVTSLFYDDHETVYVCTTKGLFKLSEDERIETLIPLISTKTMCHYKADLFMVALRDSILLINKFGKIIKEYEIPSPPNSQGFPKNQTILSLYKDTDDDVWLGTSNGLFRFNAKKDLFEPSDLLYKFENLESNMVRAIAEDRNKNIWVGTESGVFLYNKKSKKREHYGQSYDNSSNSLSDKAIYTLFLSKESIMWIGTYFGGVNYTKSKNNGFHRIIPHEYKKSISGKAISQIIEDKKSNLWIGTEDGGITIFNRKLWDFRYLKHKEGYDTSLSSNNIHALHEDRKGFVWIGTFLGGLNRYNQQSGKITTYKNDPGDSTTVSNNHVYSILQDSNERLWIGTQLGLNLFNYSTEGFTRFKPTVFGNKFIYDILEDSNKNLWFCTRNSGIYMLENQSENIVHYSTENDKTNGLTSNEIIGAYEDVHGNLWFGSLNGGVLKWDSENRSFNAIVKGKGLPNNNVYGILQDSDRGYWITTNKGLTLWNPATSESKNFTTLDGLPANQFNFKSFFKDSKGWMYFGSINGLTYFHPDSLSIQNPAPNIYFKNLKLFNKEVEIGEKSPLSSSIDRIDSLTLEHSQNTVTIEYVGINYYSEGRNSYAYYLEGFETTWNYVGNSRSATYTNLPPGDYIFHLKTVGNDSPTPVGPKKERQIALSILPPFWKTNWALAIYGVLGLIFIYLYYRFAKFIRQKNLAIELQRVEKEKINALNQHRLNFFTFISHEFKTPLTLIIASVEKFFQKSSFKDNTPEELLSIKRNAGKLHHLVQQLMHFRKIETDYARLELRKGDIVLFLKDTFGAFNPWFEYKNLTSFFETNITSYFCHFDPDKIEMIISNLVSNSIKNTDENGQVLLKIKVVAPENEDSDASITIEVTDTGNGFDQHDHDIIFTPFYTQSQKNKETTGTGIGLALVKSLVRYLKGNLQFHSIPHKGTSCRIQLPLVMDDIQPGIEVQPVSPNISISVPVDLFLEKDQPINNEAPIIQSKEMTILIAEDNQELMRFLNRHFSSTYKVIMTKNGKDALSKLQKKKPDIIVSDIKMPIMNGIEFCEMVKSDPNTSHIPFILLTGQTHESAKIEALTVGANAYMAKPFKLEELDLLIRNQLKSSKNIAHRFSGLASSESRGIIPKSNSEREFLLQITSLIEANYNNPDFTIKKLSDIIGISRSLLHMKMKKITGLSASEYIKREKMEKALLFFERGYTISEVAYKVGYNDPNYFSRVFKKQRGLSPSVYLQKKRAGYLN